MSRRDGPAEAHSLVAYLLSAAMVLLASLFGLLVDAWIQPPNISMVFLAAVLYSAIRHGLWPSMFASLLSTLLYNFLFLDPRYSLTIDDPSNVVALVFLLIVAVLTSNLTGRLKREAARARAHATANAALYAFSGKIAGIGQLDDLVWAAGHQLAAMLDARAMILLPLDGALKLSGSYPPEDQLTAADRAAAERAWLDGKASDITSTSTRWLFVPMKSARGPVGAIGLRRDPERAFSPADRQLIEALADQTAVAIERIELARETETARLAAETERLRVALLSAISHDFRTPLAAIIGSASTLQSLWEKLDAAARSGLLTTIREESERLNRFIGNVLEMTKLEAGKLQVRLEAVELPDLISATRQEMAAVLAQHRVEIHAPPGTPPAIIDPILYRQVVANLLDNAAKFAPEGSRIDIRLSAETAVVIAEFLDQGPGIPPEHLDAIFERFFRIGGGDRRRAGTGLGLAICRGLVEAMGGTIAARNRENRGGAIFTVTVPAATVSRMHRMEEPLGHDGAAHPGGG